MSAKDKEIKMSLVKSHLQKTWANLNSGKAAVMDDPETTAPGDKTSGVISSGTENPMTGTEVSDVGGTSSVLPEEENAQQNRVRRFSVISPDRQ